MNWLAPLTIKVDGQEISVDLEEELSITELNRDMTEVSARMAYWGAVAASAEAERATADAWYRRWRAEFQKAILGNDPKLAEWKVKAQIEADPKFVELKQALALAEKHVGVARSAYESFRVKASILQSKGAMARQSLDVQTSSRSYEAPKTGTDSRVEALKKMNKSKKQARASRKRG